MNTNKLMQDFETKFREELQNVEFPKDNIVAVFYDYKGLSIASKSIMKLGCNVETYEKLISITPDTPIDLYTISFAINAIEQSSPFDLDLQLNEYLDVIKQTRVIAEKWNELVEPIKQRVLQEMQPKAARSPMSVIPNGRGSRKTGR
jgi:rRNA processing protein Krr1/Pno1